MNHEHLKDDEEDQSSNVFLEEPITSSQPSAHWSHGQTVILLNLYKKYCDRIGYGDVRTLKQMFVKISREMQEKHKTKFTASHCENRWRVIKRTYTRQLNEPKKYGLQRFFPYTDLMDKIFGDSKQDLIISPQTPAPVASASFIRPRKKFILPQPAQTYVPASVKRLLESTKKEARKEFHSESLEIEWEKLEFQKRKFDESKEMELRRMEQKDEELRLMRQRNDILERYLEYQVELPN